MCWRLGWRGWRQQGVPLSWPVPFRGVRGSWGCSLKRGQQQALCWWRVRHESDEGQTGSLAARRPALGESFLIATALRSPLCLEVVAPPSPLFYKVVSYSSRSWMRASSLYCSLGGDGEHSKAKMAFRRLRSKTCLSHAGYLFLNRSILMTDSSIRGGREDGVDGAVGLTWKTGTHPSRSVNFWSRSPATLRLLEMDRKVLVATSGGRVKATEGSSQAQLGDCPNRGPLGWKKA